MKVSGAQKPSRASHLQIWAQHMAQRVLPTNTSVEMRYLGTFLILRQLATYLDAGSRPVVRSISILVSSSLARQHRYRILQHRDKNYKDYKDH